MNRTLLLAAALTACTTGKGATRDGVVDESNPAGAGPIASEIQKECRTQNLHDISQLNSIAEQRCDRPMMALTLTAFDMGTLAGEADARDEIDLSADTCICTQE